MNAQNDINHPMPAHMQKPHNLYSYDNFGQTSSSTSLSLELAKKL